MTTDAQPADAAKDGEAAPDAATAPERGRRPWAKPLVDALRGTAGLFWAKGEAAVWFWSLVIGLAAGYAALGFRLAIQAVQFGAFGAFDEAGLSDALAGLEWWHVMAAPVGGGLVVSLLLWIGYRAGWLPDQRSEGVADVIEARAVRKGRIRLGPAAMSGAISAVTLGSGASAGREGPVVHLGAAVGALFSEGLGLPPRQARTLLACGAAAGIAASFNAPIAGVLFALEVVLGHYALRVIAPVSIASLVAAVVARVHLGPEVAFPVPPLAEAHLMDFPAAGVLGALSAIVAIVFMRVTLSATTRVAAAANRIRYPRWALPPIGGVLVGGIAVAIPEVLGVGYDAAGAALAGQYAVGLLVTLAAAKLAATVLTLAFRFGGGVFSPAMVIGAAMGAAFGALLQMAGVDSAGASFHGLIGMGAVAGAVLGAPISTTLIVFELTRSYEAGAAMLAAVSIATVIVQSSMGGSYFQKQIERRGWQLAQGPQRLILQTVRVRDFMTPANALEEKQMPEGATLFEDDSLGRALALFKAEDLDGAAVKRRGGDQAVVGYVGRTDALVAYNNALVDAHVERSR